MFTAKAEIHYERNNIYTDRILDYEMVHWMEESLFIAHKANQITYKKDGKETVIEIPTDALGWKKHFMYFRKMRRLFRLDKVSIYPTEKGLVLVRFGCIYTYDCGTKEWNKSQFRLNCRNPMYNGITEANGALFIGEYGDADGVGKRVLKSTDGGLNWTCVYQFKPDDIRHIHCLAWDPYGENIWIFSGDADAECRVLKANADFNTVTEVGGGSQKWRACHAMFSEESVDWIMDSPLEEVHHIRFIRKTGEITVGEAFDGPVWFARKYDSGIAIAASAQEIGPSHKDRYVHVYTSMNMNKWIERYRFSHDGWPKGYFRFGTITLARSTGKVMCFEGIKGYDGVSVLIDDIDLK